MNLGCNLSYSSPQILVATALAIPIYIRSEIDLDLGLDVGIAGWNANGPQWSGSFEFAL